MLLTLVLAAATVTGAPIYRCDPDAGNRHDVDCDLAIAAWKAGWQPTAPEKSVAIAEQRARDRADANLMARYPNQAAYWKSRQADLAPLMASFKITETRISMLAAEKVSLDNEKEFYPHGRLPAKLALAEDENAASLVPLRRIAAEQQARIAQANAFYDGQLVHLMRLWGCTSHQTRVVANPVLQLQPGPFPIARVIAEIGGDAVRGLESKCFNPSPD